MKERESKVERKEGEKKRGKKGMENIVRSGMCCRFEIKDVEHIRITFLALIIYN